MYLAFILCAPIILWHWGCFLWPINDGAIFLENAYANYVLAQESFWKFLLSAHPDIYKPLLLTYLGGISLSISRGNVQYAILLYNSIFYFLFIYGFYRLVRHLYGKNISIICTTILGTLPWVLFNGMIFEAELSYLACSLWTCVNFLESDNFAKQKQTFLVFISLFGAIASRPVETILFTIPIFIILIRARRQPLTLQWRYISLFLPPIVSCVLFLFQRFPPQLIEILLVNITFTVILFILRFYNTSGVARSPLLNGIFLFSLLSLWRFSVVAPAIKHWILVELSVEKHVSYLNQEQMNLFDFLRIISVKIMPHVIIIFIALTLIILIKSILSKKTAIINRSKKTHYIELPFIALFSIASLCAIKGFISPHYFYFPIIICAIGLIGVAEKQVLKYWPVTVSFALVVVAINIYSSLLPMNLVPRVHGKKLPQLLPTIDTYRDWAEISSQSRQIVSMIGEYLPKDDNPDTKISIIVTDEWQSMVKTEVITSGLRILGYRNQIFSTVLNLREKENLPKSMKYFKDMMNQDYLILGSTLNLNELMNNEQFSKTLAWAAIDANMLIYPLATIELPAENNLQIHFLYLFDKRRFADMQNENSAPLMAQVGGL